MNTKRFNFSLADRLIVFACLIGLLAASFAVVPYLNNPYRFEDDARQHIFWTYKYRDKELFQNDFLASFMSSPQFAPFGYKTLYWLAAQFIDPLLFSKIFSFLLFPFFSIGIFLLGKEIRDEYVGILMAFLGLIYYEPVLAGSFQRSFSPILLVFFLYSVLRKKPWEVGIVLFLTTLFYPPIFLNCILLLPLLWREKKSFSMNLFRKSFVPLAILLFCAGAVLCAAYFLTTTSHCYGPLVKYEDAIRMPELWEHGRRPFFNKNPWIYYVGGLQCTTRSGIGILSQPSLPALLILVCFIAVWKTGKIEIEKTAIWLIFSSLLLFVIAHCFLFELYLPVKYTSKTLPLAFIVIIATNIRRIYKVVQKSSIHVLFFQTFLKYSSVLLLITTVIPIVLAFTSRSYEPRKKLFDFVSGLPKNSLILCHPDLADDIPLICKRRVLMCSELLLPYFVGFYKEARKRTYDIFSVIYAHNQQQINKIVKKYNITHIIIRKRDYDPHLLRQPFVYYVPFNHQIKNIVSQNSDSGFFLLNNGKLKPIFKWGGFVIYELSK